MESEESESNSDIDDPGDVDEGTNVKRFLQEVIGF